MSSRSSILWGKHGHGPCMTTKVLHVGQVRSCRPRPFVSSEVETRVGRVFARPPVPRLRSGRTDWVILGRVDWQTPAKPEANSVNPEAHPVNREAQKFNQAPSVRVERSRDTGGAGLCEASRPSTSLGTNGEARARCSGRAGCIPGPSRVVADQAVPIAPAQRLPARAARASRYSVSSRSTSAATG